MRGFFEELRHRNVFRVAIAYVVAGWLLAQVADLIVDAFNLPDSFLQMIIVLLLLGFPIAVIFAWAFELTPDGLKRAHEVPIDAPKDPRSGRFLNRLTIVALVVAVAWLGWDKLQRSDSVDTPVAATAASDMSIAVLPFADFSPDADHAWFADGLTDEILNALARTRDLRVASRSSAFQYRGAAQDIPQVAAELGVAHILEGSVRRAGDRIRVTAQLIRAQRRRPPLVRNLRCQQRRFDRNPGKDRVRDRIRSRHRYGPRRTTPHGRRRNRLHCRMGGVPAHAGYRQPRPR